MIDRSRSDAIALGEKIVALLGEGQFTATYKFAVLLALLDLCLEKTSASGAAPDVITTRELAERVVATYWPHCIPYVEPQRAGILRQSLGGRVSQAEVVRLITDFRAEADAHPAPALQRARATRRTGYDRLLDQVEWKLIEMPLPRLQRFGGRTDEFLYRIAWDETVRRAEVGAYQRGDGGAFDNRLLLLPGVGEGLVVLNNLLGRSSTGSGRAWSRG
jgi:hypothetical protein